MKTILIDGDILIHRTAAAVEEVVCWDSAADIWSVTADGREAKQRVDLEILGLQERLGASDSILAFSDKRNFRKDVAQYYKSNRKAVRKPIVYAELRRYCEETYQTRTWPTLEADDVLGILATDSSIFGEKIIVSDDKDLMQIPGSLYRPVDESLRVITEDEGNLWFLTQTLVGDATDGYPGLPGCGEKGALKVLKEGTWDEVVSAYAKKNLSVGVALTQARLARILRAGEYDLKTGEVQLWSPND
jgi:DNA polymerase-1